MSFNSYIVVQVHQIRLKDIICQVTSEFVSRTDLFIRCNFCSDQFAAFFCSLQTICWNLRAVSLHVSIAFAIFTSLLQLPKLIRWKDMPSPLTPLTSWSNSTRHSLCEKAPRKSLVYSLNSAYLYCECIVGVVIPEWCVSEADWLLYFFLNSFTSWVSSALKTIENQKFDHIKRRIGIWVGFRLVKHVGNVTVDLSPAGSNYIYRSSTIHA